MKAKSLAFGLGIFLLLSSSFVIAGKVDYYQYLTCDSNSMYPAISCEDRLTINVVHRWDEVEVDNIYCYRPDRRSKYGNPYDLTCHRLIIVVNDLYYFKGDNLFNWDTPIERKYIATEVVYIEKA